MASGDNVVKVAAWNAEWAKRGSSRGDKIASKLESLEADIICLTEGCRELLPAYGFVIESHPDYGYPLVSGRRKALVWSRNKWTNADNFGHSSLPSGRFVRGLTETGIGEITICGICIPWRNAHVNGGRKDRSPWEDHLTYLTGLRSIIESIQHSSFVVAGDFNQRIPRKWQPIKVFEAMQATFDGLADIATAGTVPIVDNQVIDHVVLSPDLKASEVLGIDQHDDNGKKLSDHNGVVVELIKAG